MPVVICNTSVLQYLHQIDLLDLLPGSVTDNAQFTKLPTDVR